MISFFRCLEMVRPVAAVSKNAAGSNSVPLLVFWVGLCLLITASFNWAAGQSAAPQHAIAHSLSERFRTVYTLVNALVVSAVLRRVPSLGLFLPIPSWPGAVTTG